MANDNPPFTPTEIAKRIRDKVIDLNDELLLAKLAEVDVEFELRKITPDGAEQFIVWCRQEV